MVHKTFLPKGAIASKCGQFATVCRVGDTIPLMPKHAEYAKVGKSPFLNDGRRWVTYFIAKDKEGVRPTEKRPLSERCDCIAGAIGNEADDQSNECCELLQWHHDTDNKHPLEDKGGFGLWCGACERYHTAKDVRDAGIQPLHKDFRAHQHEWKSVNEYMSDIRWLHQRTKNIQNSGGAYPVWELAIQRLYVQRIAASLNFFVLDDTLLKLLINARFWARSLHDGMMDGVLCKCCGFPWDSNECLLTHLKTRRHKDWVTRMNTYPRLLSEFMVVPDGHCINARERTYYHTLAQLEDAANAQCAHIGLPLICEDCSGVYMSSKPLQLDYERTKDMPLEEKPSRLTDPMWIIPKAASKVLPRDYGGGNDEEDSDGEEIHNLKDLEAYTPLHLVPGNGVTELQAKINVSTKLCLERRITRSVRSEFQSLYQWGGH